MTAQVPKHVCNAGPEEHETYDRLCALATSGSLTSEEWSRLAEHLKVCCCCRQDIARYQQIATFGFSLIAPNDVGLEVENQWSPESAVAKLMSKLRKEEQTSPELPIPAIISAQWPSICRRLFHIPQLRYVPTYAAALAVAMAVAGLFYVAGIQRGESQVNREPVSGTQLGSNLDALLRERSDLEQQLKARSTEVDDLSRRLAHQRDAIERLLASKLSSDETAARLTKKTNDQQSENASLTLANVSLERDRASLAEKLKQSEAKLTTVQQSLERVQSQQAASLVQLAKLEDEIAALKRDPRPAQFVEARQLIPTDPDLGALMGARDLFIADVYDVDKTGSVRKPFGRVFYTRGHSLLFYAFDLDREPAGNSAKTFQVWGRRGYGDSHPLNMGMMYLDSQVSKRWMLKYDDAKALAQVDAVFVTIEPNGGSEIPKGHQLLYASLRTPPNHP